jgi:HAD superfamily hydrolase (TIGR01662 family)
VPDALVVLDIGGTLVQGPDMGPARRMARELGMDTPQRRALQEALMTIAFEEPAAVAAFIRDRLAVRDPAVEEVAGRIWRAQEDEAVPVEGAREMLAGLADAGYRLALLSNIWAPYLTSVMRHLGDAVERAVAPELRYFSFLRGAQKPSPEPFLAVLGRARIRSDRSVMVGDSYSTDMQPAAALAMKTVWALQRPEKEVSDLVRVLNRHAEPPSRTISSIAQLDGELIASLLEPR